MSSASRRPRANRPAVEFVEPGASAYSPEGRGRLRTSDERLFESWVRQSPVISVYLARLTLDRLQWLASLDRPDDSTLLVSVPLSMESARHAPGLLQIGALLTWVEDDADGGPDTLQSKWTAELASISRRDGLSPIVVRCLERLWAEDPPPVTVQQLAGRLGASPRVLRYYWRREVGHPRLADLLRWNTLMRALHLRADRSWEGVARYLGVHRRTLERIARRMTGTPLADLVQNPMRASAHLERLFDTPP